MPLYSDPGYFYSSGGASGSGYSNLYNPYTPYTSSSYGSYSGYSRGLSNSYVIPTSSRTTTFSAPSRYTPKLSTINETPLARGIMPLTRNSPKFVPTETTYSYAATPSNYQKYIPPRPILINTADIDVSASKFRRRTDESKTSPTKRSTILPPEEKSEASKPVIEKPTKNIAEIAPKKENMISEMSNNRSTIQRNRAVVRLSTIRKSVRDRSIPRPDSKKIKVDEEFKKETIKEPSLKLLELNSSEERKAKSWRDRFGDELQTKINVVKKSPGELLMERHTIPSKKDSESNSEVFVATMELPDKTSEIDDNEIIIELMPSAVCVKMPRRPSFQDICEDISSDKIDDDLNAGDLRRRASLIQEEEIKILNQLQKSESGSFQLIHLERNESDSDIHGNKKSIAKRKSKKGKKVRHKITATVDIENQPLTPIIQDHNVEEVKTSPKFKYNVDEIEQNLTIHKVFKLPKKKIDVPAIPEEKIPEPKQLEEIDFKIGIRNSVKKTKITFAQEKSKTAIQSLIEEKKIKIEEVVEKSEAKIDSTTENATKISLDKSASKLEEKNLTDTAQSKPKLLELKENKIKPSEDLKKKGNLKSPKTKETKEPKDSNLLKSPSSKPNKSSEHFKFDDESVKLVQEKDKIQIELKSVKTPVSTSPIITALPTAKPKPIIKKPAKLQKSDSGEDFWGQIGSRETLYMNKRKKNVLESLWQKREEFLDNQTEESIKNLEDIKCEVIRRKTEELQQADDEMKPSHSKVEGKRAHSNESTLCEKKKGMYRTETKSLDQEISNLSASVIKDENSADKQTEKYSTDELSKNNEFFNSSSNAQKEQQKIITSTITKIDSNTGISAKSPELKCKEVFSKKINKNEQKISPLSSEKVKIQMSSLQKIDTLKENLGKFSTENSQTETAVADATKKIITEKQEQFTPTENVNKFVAKPLSSPPPPAAKVPLKTDNASVEPSLENKELKKNVNDSKEKLNLKKSLEQEKVSDGLKKSEISTQKIVETLKTPLSCENVEKTNKTKIQLDTIKTTDHNLETLTKKVSEVKLDITAVQSEAEARENASKALAQKNPVLPPATTENVSIAAPAIPDSTIISKPKKKKTVSPTSSSLKKKSTSKGKNDFAEKQNEIEQKQIQSKEIQHEHKKSSGELKKSKTSGDVKNVVLDKIEKENDKKTENLSKDLSAMQHQLSYKILLQQNTTKSEEQVAQQHTGSNLSKFATVPNLNQCLLDVDAELDDYIPSDLEEEDEEDEEETSYESYSSQNSDSMKKKHHKKKHVKEERQFNRNKVKLDHTKKLYVKDEPAPEYKLIATPRPLCKPERFESDSDSDSDGSTDDSECETTDSSEDSDDLNPQKSAIIRMSTCSNDSGFEGGTAPSSPKRMLGTHHEARDSPSTPPSYNPAYKIETSFEQDETSYTYAQFQKSGRITAPATTIPRFKKYSVEDFHFLTVLGKGSFGKVLLAELRNTDYYYAVKCLKKDVVLEDDDVECTLIERKVLALGTKHPYLCHLFCTFQTESHLFFVMEYLNGGDLMFHIQQSGRFSEPRAKFYGAEIVSGLKFLHKKGIIYRDLKLDNVLLDFDGHVRIADFGMCKLQIYLDKTADSFCGTPDYMAPEIIKGDSYNQNVDWWSFGVLLYEMLIGQSPFSGCDEEYLFWSICNEIPLYPLTLSQEATSLLKALLEKDSARRIGSQYSPAGDICIHPFFSQIDWERLERRDITPPFKPQVKHPLDTQYFDKTFTRERVRLTPIDKDILQSMDQAQFQGFSYTNPNATLE